MNFDPKQASDPNQNLFPEVFIADVCAVGDGAHSKVSRVPKGLPYLTSKNIGKGALKLATFDRISEVDFERLFPKNSKATRRLVEGDVLIGIIGTFGNAYLYRKTDNFGVASSVGILRPDQEKLDPRFLYHVITSATFKANHTSHNSGSAQGYTNIPSIKKLPLPLPPLNQQKKIADVLGALDDRIALLRNTNATLEAIAQTLFKSWFVDFDPVHAKQEGRAPEGMDEATAALFPDSFEESELGLAPKGWPVQPIGDVVQVLGGGTPSTKEPAFWEPQEHHWVTPKDLSGLPAPILLNTERKLSTQGLAKVSSGLLPVNTVLMSSRAPIGYLVIAKIPTAINQGFIAIPPHEELSPEFLLLWCRENMDSIKQRANGSTFMEISKSAFRPIPIVKPTIDIAVAFSEVASPVFNRVAQNERQAQTLSTLRDTLLPRLISGQLRLPEVKEEFAEALTGT